MGHKGPIQRPRCIRIERARTQSLFQSSLVQSIIFYSYPKILKYAHDTMFQRLMQNIQVYKGETSDLLMYLNVKCATCPNNLQILTQGIFSQQVVISSLFFKQKYTLLCIIFIDYISLMQLFIYACCNHVMAKIAGLSIVINHHHHSCYLYLCSQGIDPQNGFLPSTRAEFLASVMRNSNVIFANTTVATATPTTTTTTTTMATATTKPAPQPTVPSTTAAPKTTVNPVAGVLDDFSLLNILVCLCQQHFCSQLPNNGG